MPSAPPAASSVVLYAKDKGRVAEFYRRTVALEVIDEQDDFVVLDRAGFEVP